MTALKIFGMLLVVLSLVSCSEEYGSNQKSGSGSGSSSQLATSQAAAPNVVVANNPPPTEARPATPSTAGLNQCLKTCGISMYCEVQTAQSSLGPPPEEEAAKAMAGLGPPPEEEAANAMAGLGPPPQEQAATPTAGLGPPPDSPAPAAPAGPSSGGSSTTAMLTPPVVVPVPSTSSAVPPPTAGYNPGNVCNSVAPPKPANVCNPKPASKPGNTCSPAGNAGQQTAAPPPQNAPPSGPTARMNSGECHTINGQTTCTDASGNSCTTAGNFCDPTAQQPTPPKPNQGPLNLKPNTQTASAAPNPSGQTNQSTSVPACSSKPPYLPWGGQGSAMITVSGGQPCGIGWHDTGATILDSMSVTSQPSHGSLRPQDQHVIIFTPAAGYKGQDSFTLSMREHNGGRSATLSVTVSVTIQ
jgi:hypothetical protein